MVTQLELGLEARVWLYLSPEPGGRQLWEGWVRLEPPPWPRISWKLGSGSCPASGSVGLCRGPESWIWNSSTPPVSPPLAGSQGPLVITKGSAAKSELSVAPVQGPSIPSLFVGHFRAESRVLISQALPVWLSCYMTDTVKNVKTSLIHKYLLNTYSVPGPELASGNQTKIPAYILIKEAVKESRSVMGNKREQFTLHKRIRKGLWAETEYSYKEHLDRGKGLRKALR